MANSQPDFTRGYQWYALALLAVANFINYMDRMILSVVLEDVKVEFALSDTQLGLLAGFAFAIFYGTVGIFIARLADRTNRTRIVAISMLLWSGVTAATGAVQNFWQLFLARVAIGVGEAGVIPTANALLADYFTPARRSLALGIFSAGATVGLMAGLSLGGWVAELYGWRWSFVVAGLPGHWLRWFGKRCVSPAGECRMAWFRSRRRIHRYRRPFASFCQRKRIYTW